VVAAVVGLAGLASVIGLASVVSVAGVVGVAGVVKAALSAFSFSFFSILDLRFLLRTIISETIAANAVPIDITNLYFE